MRHLISFGTIGLLLAPVVAWSQQPTALVPGSRVRITEKASKPRAGTVVTASADSVVLKVDSAGQTATFSVAKISQLEVSRGIKGHAGNGVALGLLVGAGTGALVASLACGGGSTDCYDGESGPVTLAAAGLGAVVGMVTGAVIGSNHKSESWEAVPSSNWHLSTVPSTRGGLALSLSVRF
jgi:hypothetical protein